MAEAVARAMTNHEHLLVQAGTGTGKSLGYLVPALLHHRRVVVATATLALQHQLVERDIPALLAADDLITHSGRKTPTHAVLKGRSNYACLHRVREGVPDDQGVLVDVPEGSQGAEVLKLRSWAEKQADRGGAGDRDSAPKHTDQVWRQVSVNHRECLGATRCPFATECFAERAKEKAAQASVVVTNHSLLAIDAIEGVPMIPEYDVVVIDEAHELTARVTQAATDELSVPEVERAARRSQKHVDGTEADDLADAGDALRSAYEACDEGRLDASPPTLADALSLVRDAARALVSAFPKEQGGAGEADPGRTQARGWVQEIFKNTERMAAGLDSDVLWLSRRERQRGGDVLCVAPLQVWGQLRAKLLAEKTAIFTSATLMLGGDFNTVATSIGLKPSERVDEASIDAGAAPLEAELVEASENPEPEAAPDDLHGREPWRGHRRRVTLRLRPPGDPLRRQAPAAARPRRPRRGPGRRDRRPGRRRRRPHPRAVLVAGVAAEAAAEAARARLPHLTILAQGEAQLPELARLFVQDPHACLFGTLSLWQGLDVPGDTCQLVMIDRIPFPRPDDPLMSARQRAADRAGGNGFMAVAATHAALLLAQGSGRLIRTTADKGVVAILDPRLVTARYGRFLADSLPPMWRTTDREVVLTALKRLSA